MKRVLRTLLLVGIVAGIVAFVRSRRSSDPLPQVGEPGGNTWPRLVDEPARPSAMAGVATTEEPSTAAEAPADDTADEDTDEADDSGQTWVAPTDDGQCPEGYPLKANVDSGIYHAPGQMSYDRTVPERCYATGEDAEADGFRAAKR